MHRSLICFHQGKVDGDESETTANDTAAAAADAETTTAAAPDNTAAADTNSSTDDDATAPASATGTADAGEESKDAQVWDLLESGENDTRLKWCWWQEKDEDDKPGQKKEDDKVMTWLQSTHSHSHIPHALIHACSVSSILTVV